MAQYTVTTSDSEEQALQWCAANGEPPTDAASYFDARMHEVLHSYEQQYAVKTASAPVEDVAVAYAAADTPTQVQVNTLLGVETTNPGA